METLTLEGLVGSKDDIMAEMLRHPSVNGKKSVTPETALKAAYNAVENAVIVNVQAMLQPQLNEAYDLHCMIAGGPDDITDANADDWHEALDTAIENAVQPYNEYLSQDWLGKNTIDTRAHEQGRIEAIAKSAAMECFKQVCSTRKPGQVLAAVGNLKSEVEAVLESVTDDDNADAQPMAVQALKEIASVLSIFYVSADTFDFANLKDELDSLTGTDEVLSGGAASRLEVNEDGMRALTKYRNVLASGGNGDPMQELVGMVEALLENPSAYDDLLVSAAKAAKAEKPKRNTAKGKEAAAADAAANGLDPEVLAILKARTTVKDKDIGEQLGMSRASFNNKCNGKGDPITEPEHKRIIRDILIEFRDDLTRAVELIGDIDA